MASVSGSRGLTTSVLRLAISVPALQRLPPRLPNRHTSDDLYGSPAQPLACLLSILSSFRLSPHHLAHLSFFIPPPSFLIRHLSHTLCFLILLTPSIVLALHP